MLAGGRSPTGSVEVQWCAECLDDVGRDPNRKARNFGVGDQTTTP